MYRIPDNKSMRQKLYQNMEVENEKFLDVIANNDEKTSGIISLSNQRKKQKDKTD